MPTVQDITNISIDGNGSIVLPPMGREYSESEEMIAAEGRAISGKLRRDFVAAKKTFTIQYSWLSNTDFEAVAAFVNNNLDAEVQLSVTYDAINNKVGTYDVLLSVAARGDRRLAPPFAGDGAWENITLTMVEV